jgi:hypothetical protein
MRLARERVHHSRRVRVAFAPRVFGSVFVHGATLAIAGPDADHRPDAYTDPVDHLGVIDESQSHDEPPLKPGRALSGRPGVDRHYVSTAAARGRCLVRAPRRLDARTMGMFVPALLSLGVLLSRGRLPTLTRLRRTT